MDIEKNLEDTLSRLMTEYRKLTFSQPADLAPLLKLFLKQISQASSPQLHYFKEKYQGELQRMKPIISKFDRSLHDKIFNKLNISRYVSNVTSIFEEFIKGITYFEDERENNVTPIYHRLYSCGPYEDTHRLGNLICTDILTKAEINRRRPLIERCYVERLIYDEIYKNYALYFPYKNEPPSQDDGHLFRMKITKEDFETCFPSTQIEVHIDHEENLPIRATIVRTHNGVKTCIKYQKYFTISPFFGVKVYQENVDVEKLDSLGNISIKTSRYGSRGKFVSMKK